MLTVYENTSKSKLRAQCAIAIIAASAFVAVPGVAHAQSSDVSRASEQRIRERAIIESQRPREELPLFTEEFVLLQRTAPFTLSADVGAEHTNNVFWSQDKVSDTLAFGSISLGFETVVVQTYDVEFDIGISAYEYDENSELDSIDPFASASITRSIGEFELELNGYAGASYDTATQNRSFTFYSMGSTLSKTFYFSEDINLEPYISFAREWTDPRDFQAYEGGVGMELEVDLSDNVSATINGFTSYRDFDDHANDPETGETREDIAFVASAGVEWYFNNNMTFELDVAARTNRSSLSENDYDRWAILPSFSVEIRF